MIQSQKTKKISTLTYLKVPESVSLEKKTIKVNFAYGSSPQKCSINT